MSAERQLSGSLDRGDRSQQEALQPTEIIRFINGYRGVTIAGAPAVGGSSLGIAIRECIDGESFFYDAGRGIRSATGHRRSTTKYMPRDRSKDDAVDAKTRRLVERATPEHPAIIVGKIAALEALKLTLKDPQRIQIARALVTCDRKKAAARAVKRTLEDIDEEFFALVDERKAGRISEATFTIKTLELSEIRAETTISATIDDIQNRVREDLAFWWTIRPEIADVDIYDERATAIVNGQRYSLYNIRVSTNHGGVKGATHDLIEKLKEIGAVEGVPTEKTQDEKVVVFEASKDQSR